MLIKKLTFFNTYAEAIPDLRLHSLDHIKHVLKEFKNLKRRLSLEQIKAYVKQTSKAGWYSMFLKMRST